MSNSRKITLDVIPFKNPSGHLVHRVSGYIHGERVQKNFPTELKARTFMNGLIADANQGESARQRLTTTSLAEDGDLREAELAWERLREKVPAGSLITAVDYYLANAGHIIQDGDAKVIIETFIEHRRKRGNKADTLSVSKSILLRFLADSGITRISEFTPNKAEDFIFDARVVERTRQDRRGQLHNFAEYLAKQRFLSRNFVADIDRPKVTYHGKITTLSAEQVLKLLRHAATAPVGRDKVRGVMLPYFAICALSGVRPDEAKRLGADWAWFSKENRVITGFRAKNSNRTRTVEIHTDLVQILEYCREKGFAPSQFSVKAFNHIRTHTGVFDRWDNDILRHTYASHLYAWKKDIAWLSKNMGNSEDVLKRSYLDQTIIENTGKGYFELTLSQIIH
jgi:integrase